MYKVCRVGPRGFFYAEPEVAPQSSVEARYVDAFSAREQHPGMGRNGSVIQPAKLFEQRCVTGAAKRARGLVQFREPFGPQVIRRFDDSEPLIINRMSRLAITLGRERHGCVLKSHLAAEHCDGRRAFVFADALSQPLYGILKELLRRETEQSL